MLPTTFRYLVVLAGFAVSTAAHGLSCAPRNHTLSEAYAAADSIIVGLVTECEEEVSREAWANGGSGCAFTALEILKDSSPQRDYSGVASSSGCGLSLKVGEQYLLFLNRENRPMHFSSGLGEGGYRNRYSGDYLDILRRYRDGRTTDLSEPWRFSEVNGACSISHKVAENILVISRGTMASVVQSQPVWTPHSVNGETVYKATQQAKMSGPADKETVVQLTAYGVEPSDAPGIPTISVVVPENPREKPPRRKVTISVDGKSWPLYQLEARFVIGPSTPTTIRTHIATGDVAEQILSAMSKPADVVVVATIVEPEAEEAPPVETVAPGKATLSPALEPAVNIAPQRRQRRTSEPAPEPELRIDTRSTHLIDKLEKFQACASVAAP